MRDEAPRSARPDAPRVAREAVIDHRLRRRALAAEVREGRVDASDVCDAPRELRLAAAHLGEPAGEACPVCAADTLVSVAFVVDAAERAAVGGRPVALSEVATLALRRGSVTHHDVEVCRSCGWHHLRSTARVRGLQPTAPAGPAAPAPPPAPPAPGVTSGGTP